MNVTRAHEDISEVCESILRSLPEWFGIESALVQYVEDTRRFPTFAARDGERIVGFVTLRQHFEFSWEVHCIAVERNMRRSGTGRALMEFAEAWLADRNAVFLQVKTVSATSPAESYSETREFYAALGFLPVEEFPTLWSERHPCLQMMKLIPGDAHTAPPER